ncbi:MAG: hypothetical protein JXA25_04295 [Anaerolineales bacterium]|nr:hypothetical protein [Anaerolineales bacterium]
MKKKFILLIVFSLLLTGCGQPEGAGATAQGDEVPTQVQTSTATAQPTETFTPEPASTPTITPTPMPPSVSRLNVSRLALLDEILAHPGGQVLSLDISPDGAEMITGSTDYTTRIFNLDQGSVERVFYLSGVGTFAVAFSPGSSYFISGHGSGILWRVKNLSNKEIMEAILSVETSIVEDGDLVPQTFLSFDNIAYTDDMEIVAERVYRQGFSLLVPLLINPEAVNTYRAPGGVNLFGMRFDEESYNLWEQAMASENFPENWKENFADAPHEGPVWLWHYDTNDRIPEVLDIGIVSSLKTIECVAYSPVSDIFAVCTHSLDGSVRVLDAENDFASYSVPANPEGQYKQTECVDFSPDGASFATGGDSNLVRIWDTATGKMLAELDGHTSWVFDVDYSANGRFLASTGYDGRVNVWDTSTWELIQTVNHSGVLRAVLSQSGDLLFSGGNGFMLKVWDVATGEELQTIDIPSAVKAMDWTPAGDILAVGAMDGIVRFYGLKPGS